MPMRIVSLVLVNLVLTCLTGPTLAQSPAREGSAWQTLLSDHPGIVDDPAVTWKDRLILNALTPEQASQYFSGAIDGQGLMLPDGSTLVQYLERNLTPPGQVFVPLWGNCSATVLPTSSGRSDLRVVTARARRPPTNDGSPAGCTIPQSASAVLLQARVRASAGQVPRVKLWAADLPEPAAAQGSEPPLTGSTIFETTLLAPLCHGRCPEGDWLLRTGGSDVTLRAIGYLVLPEVDEVRRRKPASETRRAEPGAGVTGLTNLTAPSTESNNNNFFGTGAGSNTTGDSNSFFGASAGAGNTSGSFNSYFGWNAGASATGNSNTFVGAGAGQNNTGNANAFFGRDAGMANTTGSDNLFLGRSAGISNNAGADNTFAGSNAGFANTSGGNNAFLGRSSGFNNTTGGTNVFVGRSSGFSNTTENNNTFVGGFSNGVGGITNATAIGYQAQASQSNSLVLGSIAGVNGATNSVKVGIGTSSPTVPLYVFTPNAPSPGTVVVFDNGAGPARFRFRNGANGETWNVGHRSPEGTGLVFSDVGDAVSEMILDVNGNLTIAGVLTQSSDARRKTAIEPVSARSMLDKVVRLPIAEWSYKEDPSVRHVGPMAQDFRAAFGLGDTETGIAAVDADGVSLASIQALYGLIEELRAEVQTLREELRRPGSE